MGAIPSITNPFWGGNCDYFSKPGYGLDHCDCRALDVVAQHAVWIAVGRTGQEQQALLVVHEDAGIRQGIYGQATLTRAVGYYDRACGVYVGEGPTQQEKLGVSAMKRGQAA